MLCYFCPPPSYSHSVADVAVGVEYSKTQSLIPSSASPSLLCVCATQRQIQTAK